MESEEEVCGETGSSHEQETDTKNNERMLDELPKSQYSKGSIYGKKKSDSPPVISSAVSGGAAGDSVMEEELILPDVPHVTASVPASALKTEMQFSLEMEMSSVQVGLAYEIHKRKRIMEAREKISTIPSKFCKFVGVNL